MQRVKITSWKSVLQIEPMLWAKMLFFTFYVTLTFNFELGHQKLNGLYSRWSQSFPSVFLKSLTLSELIKVKVKDQRSRSCMIHLSISYNMRQIGSLYDKQNKSCSQNVILTFNMTLTFNLGCQNLFIFP